jgi:hypothetical protein
MNTPILIISLCVSIMIISPFLFICLSIFDYDNIELYYSILMNLVVVDSILIIIITYILFYFDLFERETDDDNIV